MKEFAPKRSKFFPLRAAPNEEGDGLRLSHEKVHLFPSLNGINKFSKSASYSHFKFPDFSLSFLNFPDHLQYSLTFP